MRERKSVCGLTFTHCVKSFFSTTFHSLFFNLVNDEKDPKLQRLIDSDISFLLHPAKLSHILELVVSRRSSDELRDLVLFV